MSVVINEEWRPENNMVTERENLGVSKIFHVSEWIMLTKAAFIWSKTVKSNILKYYYNFKQLFYILIYFIPVIQRWIFSIITPVFSVTWSFRNHSNMLISCSRNISNSYQCWKWMCCSIFLGNWYFFFLKKKVQEQHLYETEIFCDIINPFWSMHPC